MNVYAVIVLVTLFFEFILSLGADFLNLKRLATALPQEMVGVYDPAVYRKSQEYTRMTTQFGWVVSIFMLVLTLIFWFSGGFNGVDQWLRGFRFNRVLTGVLYVGLLSLLQSLVSLSFSLYSTFVIEERFGFNKTTARLFFADRAKGLLLSLVLGGPLLAALLAFFEYGGPHAWIYAWGVVAVFQLLVQLIAPTWIMPLFNHFEPLEAGALKDAIMAFADSVHFPLQNVFVMDGSRRTSKSNAFFTGFGKNKRIALFDTLIASQTTPELVAVLAHEIGHYKKKHIVLGLGMSVLHIGAVFFLLSLFIGHAGLYDAFFMDEPSVYAALIFFGMLFTPVEFVLSLFMNMLSRKHEYEADRFAAQSIEHAETLVEALKKLAVHNLSNLTPHPFYTFLNYSHPPLLDRIRAIRTLSAG